MSALKKKDCLIHIGDVCIGKDTEMHKKYIEPLICRKILVLGNHDRKSWSWYMEHGWDFVCDVFRLTYGGKVILFSHKPAYWDGEWEVNIHGHLHNITGHRKDEKRCHDDFTRLYSPELMNYKCVNVLKMINQAQ